MKNPKTTGGIMGINLSYHSHYSKADDAKMLAGEVAAATELIGSAKQIAWAGDIRDAVVEGYKAQYAALCAQVEATGQTVPAGIQAQMERGLAYLLAHGLAAWWIDHCKDAVNGFSVEDFQRVFRLAS